MVPVSRVGCGSGVESCGWIQWPTCAFMLMIADINLVELITEINRVKKLISIGIVCTYPFNIFNSSDLINSLKIDLSFFWLMESRFNFN